MNAHREESWEEFAEGIRQLKTTLSQSSARTVRGSKARDAARGLTQQYFREVRPHLLALGFSEDELKHFDGRARALRQLSEEQSARSEYRSLLADLQRLHADLTADREIRMGAQQSGGFAIATPVERRIIETLERLKPSAARSYQQALVDLGGARRHSFRGVAHELREALRETLDHFAPDAAVMAEPRFKLEQGLTRPTQRQKALFVLRKRRLPKKALEAPELAVSTIEELGASITRSAYTRGSISAHTATPQKEVRQMKMYLDAVLAELLEIHG